MQDHMQRVLPPVYGMFVSCYSSLMEGCDGKLRAGSEEEEKGSGRWARTSAWFGFKRIPPLGNCECTNILRPE